MLRIMTPGVPTPAPCGLSRSPVAESASVASTSRRPIRNAVAATDIRVAVEIVIVVDGDVIPAPAAAATPTATPERPHHNAHTEGDRHASGVIPRGRVVDGGVGVDRGTVDHDGVIARNVHDLRTSLLNNDDLFGFDDFRFDRLLLVGFEITFLLRLLAHALHRVHYVALLR
jgi:hypothetical protein